MTVDQMRKAIIKVYPNDTWRRKVNRMYDNQVIAIYHSFKEHGKFDEVKKREKSEKKKQKYEQVSMFDFNLDKFLIDHELEWIILENEL